MLFLHNRPMNPLVRRPRKRRGRHSKGSGGRRRFSDNRQVFEHVSPTSFRQTGANHWRASKEPNDRFFRLTRKVLPKSEGRLPSSPDGRTRLTVLAEIVRNRRRRSLGLVISNTTTKNNNNTNIVVVRIEASVKPSVCARARIFFKGNLPNGVTHYSRGNLIVVLITIVFSSRTFVHIAHANA